MKYAVVILDGAADWKMPFLQDQTALQASAITILDMMAAQGTCGVARTVPEGMEVSSNGACTSILGYDPVENFVGRGAIEAAAQGITLAPDEVAMRINTLTILDGVMTSYSGDNITTEESYDIVARLAELLNDEVFTIYPGKAYRHILVVKGHPEILDFSYTPPHDISDQPVTDKTLPQGEGSELLWHFMQAAHEALKDCPANKARAEAGKLPITDLWPFWPGAAPRDLTPFEEARGLRGTMTSSVDLLRGLSVLFGFNFMEVDGVTDGLDNDFGAQANAAIEALENDEADLAIVHVEAPDEMGHQGDIEGKMRAIECIDRDIMTRLFAFARKMSVENGGPGFRILAMPDHFTPIETRTHEGDPVPFLIWGDGIEANGAEAYSEEECVKTGLSLDPEGYKVMDLLVQAND
ncbi:MAG: 2,3-bisphosphoglycerate-independent phosphoglycerate mutase [Coriobacteriia bacterium]|nr:2,3-bisphosphoglycerate-independent phosphoglycerate mutase [Coriobacteriia bacterium]